MLDRTGEAAEVVTAFEDGDEAVLAVRGGVVEQELGQFGKVVVGEAELAERIVDAGVESG